MSPSPSSSPPPPPFPHRRTEDARRYSPYGSNFSAACRFFAQQALQGELRSSSQSDRFRDVNSMYFGQEAGFLGGRVLRWAAGDDQARREAEKKRIREELLAREAMWRREFEEEVMQELAIEREQERAFRRRQSNPVPMPSSASSILSPESARPILAPHLRDSLFREKLLRPLALRGEAEGGLFQRAPEERRTVDGRPKPVFQVGRRTASTEETAAGPSISAVKRILPPSSPSLENGKSLVPKKARKEMNCDICQVTASSLQVLIDHLGGKKHKLKEAEILGGKVGADPSNGKSDEMVNTDSKKMEFTARKDFKRPNKQRKNKNHADGNVDQFKKNRKKVSLFCEYCRVECFSEIVMATHHRGKKHKFRMEQLSKSLTKNSNGSVLLEESLKEETAGVVTSDNEVKRSEVGEKEVNDKFDLDKLNEVVVKESLKEEATGVVISEDKRSEVGDKEINDTLDLYVGNGAVVKEIHEMAYLDEGSELVVKEVDGESDQVKINE